MSDYKVCILAAGVGSRMGKLSKTVHKAILPINFKGTISHIIEKISDNIEIIIAVGYMKESIIDYLALAYPERKFTFIEIDNYIGSGTGPGHTLLQCKDMLQCPFILCTADTIVLEEIPPPYQNWLGIAPVSNPESYCTVKIKNDLIYEINDKISTNNKFAWIGLAGIHNYEKFFLELERDNDLISGELQVSNGFKHLIEKSLIPLEFTWFDTGTYENYLEVCKHFYGNSPKFDFGKSDEFLYFVNGRVIKYFADSEIISKRFERTKILKHLVPKIESKRKNFYSYKKVAGNTLYETLNNKLLHDFLYQAKTHLWKKKKINKTEKNDFIEACNKFYKDKTLERLEKFYEKTGIKDCENKINGILIPSVENLFSQIDWNEICAGIPATIHGDLQFDNILVTKDEHTKMGKFMLIDWRQDFGGLTKVGDLYYDLAKMYGGMIVSYKLIKEGMFSFEMSGSDVHYNFHISNDLLEAKVIYEKFLEQNGYDLKKIKLIVGLIFINMAPLHHDPFDHLLFFLGKNIIYTHYINDNIILK